MRISVKTAPQQPTGLTAPGGRQRSLRRRSPLMTVSRATVPIVSRAVIRISTTVRGGSLRRLNALTRLSFAVATLTVRLSFLKGQPFFLGDLQVIVTAAPAGRRRMANLGSRTLLPKAT